MNITLQLKDTQRRFLQWVVDNKDFDTDYDDFAKQQEINKIIVQGSYGKSSKKLLNDIRKQYLVEYKFYCFDDGDLLYIMDDVQSQWLLSIRKTNWRNSYKNTPKGIYIECYDKYDLVNKKLKGCSDLKISKNPQILKKANSAQTDLMTRKIKEKTKLQ